MANKTISDLTAAGAVDDADVYEVEQSGASKKITWANIKSALLSYFFGGWVTGTPTFTGFGTVSGLTYYSKLEPDGTLHGEVTVTTGTTTGTEARMSLVHNGVAKTSATTYPTLQYLCGLATNSAGNNYSVMVEANKGYLVFGTPAGNLLAKDLASNIFGNGWVLSFKFSVRVQ